MTDERLAELRATIDDSLNFGDMFAAASDLLAEVDRLRAASPWISVADRLPADLAPVLVWVAGPAGSGPCIARLNVAAASWEMQGTLDWKDNVWSPMAINVTHWIDLPLGAK